MAGTSGTTGSARSRPTMRHVAALAGVGTKTVSRVINGEPNVSEETIDRVHEAIARLNYQPDLYAANLKRANGRTLTLGFVVGSVADPFSAAVHRAIEEKAWERNTAVFSASHDYDPEREHRIVGAFLGRRIDGLILGSASWRHSYRAVEAVKGTSLVFVDPVPVGVDADTVTTNNAAGAAEAAGHLLRFGHRSTDGKKVGKVEDLKMGDPEAVTADGQIDPATGGLVGTVIDDFAKASKLPHHTAERLLRIGYVKIDKSGLLAGHTYVASDELDRVEGDTLWLKEGLHPDH